jgi:hypothetical protein
MTLRERLSAERREHARVMVTDEDRMKTKDELEAQFAASLLRRAKRTAQPLHVAFLDFCDSRGLDVDLMVRFLNADVRAEIERESTALNLLTGRRAIALPEEDDDDGD